MTDVLDSYKSLASTINNSNSKEHQEEQEQTNYNWGSSITSFILVNIIIQDIIFDVNTGALISAITYQLIILIILWMNKSNIIKAFQILTLHPTEKHPLKKKALKFLITFILFVLLWFLIHYTTSYLSHL